ncbi:TrbI/VirB10 family protein [Dyella sp. 2RAB6]|uniref:TrbI/VirB10 family protein n=1 Tax=Dyella sp. 2RAB6 TaxID=3232992 RepID=UPI003F8EBB9A
MSSNNPYEGSGQGAPQDNPQGSGEPLSSNPYHTNYQQQQSVPDLDANAPQLRSNDLKRMNRRALAFMGGILALMVVLAFWLISGATRHDAPKKAKEETVTVPDAPKPIPLPPPPPRLPEPIQVTQTPPLPMNTVPTPKREEGPRGPTLVERRMMTGNSAAQSVDAQGNPLPAGNPYLAGMPGANPNQPAQQQGDPNRPDFGLNSLDKNSSAQTVHNPDTLMQRGTYIRCVLETRIISDFPGFTTCIVTEPVYSFNGHKLLLPKGSKVLGKYQSVPKGPRIAVIWDRIITPNGVDVNMSSPGIDNLGSAGHPGQYDAHWPSRIGAAMLISLLSDAFKYEAAEHGPRQTTVSNGVVTQSPFESNTAATIQTLASQAVREAANRLPTVTVNQGTVLYVYVAKDVDFSGVVSRL